MAIMLAAGGSVSAEPWFERYKAKEDREVAFSTAFGTTSVRTWTDDGLRLETFLGRSSVSGFLSNPDALVLQLETYLLVPAANLRLFRRVDTDAGRHFEYQQFVNGAVLENALLFFDLDRSGALVALFNRTAPFPKPLKASEISVAAAQCYAAAQVVPGYFDCNTSRPILPPAAEKLQFATGKVWYVTEGRDRRTIESFAVVVTSLDPYTIKRYVVDGRTGDILEVRDRVQKFTGSARVFNPNPFAKGSNPVFNTVADGDYEPCELDGLATPASGTDYLLVGDYVKISDFYPQQIREPVVIGLNGQFPAPRGANDFASAMIYCHVDHMQRYVQSLKIGDIARRQIDADPRDGLNSNNYNGEYENNASGTGRLVFGFRDDPDAIYVAEDGDVIAHEYGHALQASQALEHYREPEGAAMSEGFADYWAFTYFEKENAAHLETGCYAEWMCRAPGDGLCTTGCDRDVDLTCTRLCYHPNVGPHTNGRVWTATLWKIRQAFGRDTANQIILKSHWSVPDKPSFADGARALLAADGLLNQYAHFDVLCDMLSSEQKLLDPLDCAVLRGKLHPSP